MWVFTVMLLGLWVLSFGLVRVQADISDTPRFDAAPCMFIVPDGYNVECGYLVVPEDRSNPLSRTIELAVAVVHSLSQNPAPDPMLYLSGGPGGYLLTNADYYIERFAPVLAERDLILFDQRGVGFSQPSLDCPEFQQYYYESLATDFEFDELLDDSIRVALACSNRLAEEGVNIRAYNTPASAADVADLRVVLGYAEWNILGISYGTRLALTIMRDHPTGVRSVILDSVVPLQADGLAAIVEAADRAFSILFAGCAADAVCNAAYPDLESRFWRTYERLNANPVRLNVPHPETGEMYPLLITGEVFGDVLFRSLYSTELITYMPVVITYADQGYYEPVGNLAMFFTSNFETFSVGMYYSANCRDEVTFSSLATINQSVSLHPRAAFMAEGSIIEMAICSVWESGIGDPLDNAPVHSTIPTLVLSGEYDPITPPARGSLAATTLVNSFVFEFPGLGHGTSLADSCPIAMVVDFLNAPTTAPDASCIDVMTGPQFVIQ